jgi:hypothetical protein
MFRGSFEFPNARLHEIYADTRLQLLKEIIGLLQQEYPE